MSNEKSSIIDKTYKIASKIWLVEFAKCLESMLPKSKMNFEFDADKMEADVQRMFNQGTPYQKAAQACAFGYANVKVEDANLPKLDFTNQEVCNFIWEAHFQMAVLEIFGNLDMLLGNAPVPGELESFHEQYPNCKDAARAFLSERFEDWEAKAKPDPKFNGLQFVLFPSASAQALKQLELLAMLVKLVSKPKAA